jgi:KaiC/GvpD/RAD55 family RecA-like ATPase
MEQYKNAYEKVIQKINWRNIKSYHKKLDIRWEIEEDKEMISRIPHVSELKSDLRSIFDHMLEENIHYISYGNWIIFWDREGGNVGDIRVIFRLAEFVFEEDKKSMAALESALEKAIESEDYETAAYIRDELNKKLKTI